MDDSEYIKMVSQSLVGKTISSVTLKSTDEGNYVRWWFSDGGYSEWLMHFSPAEHQLEVAKKALENLYRGPYGGPTAYTAGQALKSMEKFQ